VEVASRFFVLHSPVLARALASRMLTLPFKVKLCFICLNFLGRDLTPMEAMVGRRYGSRLAHLHQRGIPRPGVLGVLKPPQTFLGSPDAPWCPHLMAGLEWLAWQLRVVCLFQFSCSEQMHSSLPVLSKGRTRLFWRPLWSVLLCSCSWMPLGLIFPDCRWNSSGTAAGL
jgi:hypothetical protein